MLTLLFDKKSEKIEALEERFKEMSLGYKLKKKKKASTIELKDGERSFKGYKAINKYLDEIQGELRQWWYCDC